jgi:thioesterase domain-containing protein/acyl carrier protein
MNEIEVTLVALPSIQHAAVMYHLEKLIAFIVPHQNAKPQDLQRTAILTRLKASLPHYMLPTAFITIEKMPTTDTANKINYSKLKQMYETMQLTNNNSNNNKGTDDNSYGQLSPLATQLLRIWETILESSSVNPTDDFFMDLGGNSLLAVRLCSTIEQCLGIQLPVSMLFRAPTVEQLAVMLESEDSSNHTSALVPIRLASPKGIQKYPLFCIHPSGGGALVYAEMAKEFDVDQALFGLEDPSVSFGPTEQQAQLEKQRFASLQQMAAHYLENIRRIQPTGPYHLCGFSSGGIVAAEIAAQLEKQGEVVACVAMFDSAFSAPTPSLSYLLRRFLEVMKYVLQPEDRPQLNIEEIEAAGSEDAAWKIVDKALQPWQQTLARQFVSNFLYHIRLLQQYKPAKLQNTSVILYKAESEIESTVLAQWNYLVEQKFEVIHTGGTHDTIMQPPYSTSIIKDLSNRISYK